MLPNQVGLYPFIAGSLLSVSYVPWFEASGEFYFLAAITKICPILYLIWYTKSYLSSAYERHSNNKRSRANTLLEQRCLLASGISTGLLFSVVGDVILLLRKRNDYCFVLGTLAFAVTQISYIKAIGFDHIDKFIGLSLYAVAAVMLTYLIKGAPLIFQIILPAYGALLTTSLWRSIDRASVEDGRSKEQKRQLVLGFVFFLVSDLWIGVSTFAVTSYHVLSAQFVLATYYVAQGLITFSVS